MSIRPNAAMVSASMPKRLARTEFISLRRDEGLMDEVVGLV